MSLRLPRFEQPEDTTLTQRDARSYLYAKHTELPLLKAAGDAFETALKEASERAWNEQPSVAPVPWSIGLWDHTFTVTAKNSASNPGHSPALDKTLSHLESLAMDAPSTHRRTLLVLDERRYVRADRLVRTVESFYSPREPSRSLVLERRIGGEKPELDPDIDELIVSLDANHYRALTAANSRDTHLAASLSARIGAFIKDFESRALYWAQDHGLDGDTQEPLFMQFDDGSSLRIQPYTKPSVSYAKIMGALFAPKKELLTANVGDLAIIADLGVEATYERTGKGALRVSSAPEGDVHRVTVARDGSERSYRVVDGIGAFVAIEDIAKNLAAIRQAYTTDKIEIKTDAFLSPPAYLR